MEKKKYWEDRARACAERAAKDLAEANEYLLRAEIKDKQYDIDYVDVISEEEQE